jgi:type IV pilus assembly protein PilA
MHLEPSDKSGFTLVETMIVLVIIGLMAGVAIPSFVKAREAAKLKPVGKQLRNTEVAKSQ